MKKPLVRWTCGSVCRNSGRRRVAELRPLLDRLDLEAGRVDDGLGLVRVDRADRVDDRAARPHALGGRPQQLELELGQRLRAPAQVGPRSEDAEPRARRVDERAVEAGQLGRQRASVRVDDADVRRRRAGGRSPRARAPGPRSPRPRRPRRRASSPSRPARRRGRARARRGCEPTQSPASCEPRLCGQISPLRERLLVDALDLATRPGRPSSAPVRGLAADESDDGRGRLVLRAHQRERAPPRRGRAARRPRSSPGRSA